MKSGTLNDILIWCIIHSTKPQKRNEDAAAFLLCFHWVCSPSMLFKTIQAQWKKWKAVGFPNNLGRKEMVERLKNFVYHYSESPVSSGNYSEETATRQKLREFVQAKQRSSEEFLRKANIPRKLTRNS